MNATVTKGTLREQLTYQGVLMVDVTIDYPVMTGGACEGGRREFNRHYARQARSLVRHARLNLLPEAIAQYRDALANGFPFHPYALVQTFEVTYHAGVLVSLFLDEYEYTGGAHGNTIREGNTWDLRRRRMLKLHDLFRPGYDYRGPILQVVAQEAHRRQTSGEVDYFEGLDENLLEHFDEDNYYLTYAGLAVFYPLYTIGPYAIGIQVFVVPYGVFGSNLVYPLFSLA